MKIIEYIKHPYKIALSAAALGAFKNMDDEKYLKFMYRIRMGKELNLNQPQTFNEKLQWIKLYDRNPQYSKMVDKYEVKEYVSGIIGSEYIIPTIGVWDNLEDVDFSELPDLFVIKTTHDSGGVVICKDKKNFNIENAKKKLKKSLFRNYYQYMREWPYKYVKPRIIVEHYLAALGSGKLIEYKIFCFNGEPKLFLVCQGEGHGVGRTNDFYDLDFNHIPVTITNPNSKEFCKKPAEYDELIRLAKLLSHDIPQLRVDFYVEEGKIYFGELTFFHDSGFCHFEPESYDLEFGKLISLPNRREE